MCVTVPCGFCREREERKVRREREREREREERRRGGGGGGELPLVGYQFLVYERAFEGGY